MEYVRIGSAYQLVADSLIQTNIIGYDIECDQFHLYKDGSLLARKYYTWDGATGALDTKSIIRASCGHDILCDLVNAGQLPIELQPMIDKCLVDTIEVYWERMKKDGTPWQKFKATILSPTRTIRRKLIYRAVRAYQSSKKKPYIRRVYVVP